jgi:hypothetical protein
LWMVGVDPERADLIEVSSPAAEGPIAAVTWSDGRRTTRAVQRRASVEAAADVDGDLHLGEAAGAADALKLTAQCQAFRATLTANVHDLGSGGAVLREWVRRRTERLWSLAGRSSGPVQVLGWKISMVTVKSGVYRIGVHTTSIPNAASITSRTCPSP